MELKVGFLTLGCKVNYYETEKMIADFEAHGFEVTDFRERADVYVVNTCTVTNIADRKSRKMLHRAKRNNPDSIVVAVGCYVESGGEELLRDTAVDLALSNRDKESAATIVLDYLTEREEGSVGCVLEKGLFREGACGQGAAGEQSEAGVRMDRTRRFLKIQNGCNQFCSYCMIPYVRGGGVLSSRDEAEVLEEISWSARHGYKEVVLTGIHLSSYGVDRSEERQFVALRGAPLLSLLKKADRVSGIERIRLGSLEPRIICGEFLEGLRSLDKLCPHFHLSLQSGCDDTLRRMNRHYTAEEYREKCEMLRQAFDDPAITTDVIVGFPGETKEEFEETRRFVREVRLADIHVFPYSVRNGTRAAGMPDQVSPEEKRRRSEQLLAEAGRLREEYVSRFAGKTEKVLFEEIREIGGERFLVGHNERYVLFGVPLSVAEEKGYEVNEICPVLIENVQINKKNSCEIIVLILK